ncbi:Lrp/AsnC family transcriptional regulator [Calditerricola satsumensis]|uniref:Lrp/AsnC family transcriptional regulator n=1 Tax=Calditerricola satsumensis TaxID=373054 RepID=UPI000A749396|nr:Lrp/AsnC family transcriptional regulator [Calditerricola satsumensis]
MSVQTMDALDRELLNLLQEDLPLVPRPYQALAERLGTTEDDVLRRVAELKKTVVRQISAIFDTRALGYASSLVAARVKPELVDEAAQVINEHPASATITSATTPSTCGSPSPCRPTAASAWRRRWRFSVSAPRASSRSASCRR